LLAKQPDHRRRGDRINQAFGGRFLLHLLTAAIRDISLLRGSYVAWEQSGHGLWRVGRPDLCPSSRFIAFALARVRVLVLKLRQRRPVVARHCDV